MNSQKENLVEDGEEVFFVEMEEVEKCIEQHLKMTRGICKMRIGLCQQIWKKGVIQGKNPKEYPLLPSSEGRFTNWSSLGSPCVRTVPHEAPNREIE